MTAEETRWLADHPVITCTHDPYYPPFDILQPDGSYTGYTADLLRHAESVLGREFRAVPAATWNEGLRWVREGKVDCITSLVLTEERARFAIFSKPYFVVRPVFLERTGQTAGRDLQNLRGRRVFVTRGYAVVDHLLEKYPGISLEYVENDRIGILRLAFGEGDFAVSDYPVATYTLRQEGITNLRVAGPTGYEYPLRFATPNTVPALASILDKVIDHMDPKEHEALVRKWITPEKRFFEYTEFRVAVGLVVFLAFFSALTSWLFKRTVNRRTAELRAELARRKAAEQAVTVMNVSLGHAVARAEAASQAKSRFLRMMSHEFLTPLNQIQLHAELLEGALRGADPESVGDLQNIRQSTRHLTDQVVDILELMDMESGAVQPQMRVLDAEILATTLVARALPWAEAHHDALTIELGALPQGMEGDPDLIIQALSKLLHNACRYTMEGKVTLTVTALPGEVVFEVRDTGQGIDPQALVRVFEIFSQGEEGLTRASDGMGLGLTICQHLVQKMGGRLSATSLVGEGSVFQLHLPEVPARLGDILGKPPPQPPPVG